MKNKSIIDQISKNPRLCLSFGIISNVIDSVLSYLIAKLKVNKIKKMIL